MRKEFYASEASFTLIELLIVIGILSVLVAAVVVVLNPAQLCAGTGWKATPGHLFIESGY